MISVMLRSAVLVDSPDLAHIASFAYGVFWNHTKFNVCIYVTNVIVSCAYKLIRPIMMIGYLKRVARSGMVGSPTAEAMKKGCGDW